MPQGSSPPVQVRALLAETKDRLRSAPHSPPGREAHLLLAHVLGWSESELLARDDTVVTAEQREVLENLVDRRVRGEPIAYLTGTREFFGRRFGVDPRVLIPRPETEHLVEVALALARELPASVALLDLGTGSGCVGITLALELPGRRIIATDSSTAALALARRNAHALGAESRFHPLGSDWVSGLDPRTVGLVVSNPPYIAHREATELSSEITDFEPQRALFADSEGLAAYGRIYRGLRGLRPGTPIVTEVGRDQARPVAALASAHGFSPQRTIEDYAGIERVVVVNR